MVLLCPVQISTLSCATHDLSIYQPNIKGKHSLLSILNTSPFLSLSFSFFFILVLKFIAFPYSFFFFFLAFSYKSKKEFDFKALLYRKKETLFFYEVKGRTLILNSFMYVHFYYTVSMATVITNKPCTDCSKLIIRPTVGSILLFK